MCLSARVLTSNVLMSVSEMHCKEDYCVCHMLTHRGLQASSHSLAVLGWRLYAIIGGCVAAFGVVVLVVAAVWLHQRPQTTHR